MVDNRQFVQYSLNMQILHSGGSLTAEPVTSGRETIAFTFTGQGKSLYETVFPEEVQEYSVSGLWKTSMRAGWQILMGVDSGFWNSVVEAILEESDSQNIERGSTIFAELFIDYYVTESTSYPDHLEWDSGKYLGVLSRVSLNPERESVSISILACRKVSVSSVVDEAARIGS